MEKLLRREFLITTAAAALPAAALPVARAKPNIVFVLMDDMGYPALSS